MSTEAAPVTDTTENASPATNVEEKGKNKAPVTETELSDELLDLEEEEDDDDDDDDEMEDYDEEEEEDEDDDEDGEKIDPASILPRRTRGVKIDYSSAEALSKAGLKPEELDEDADADVSMG
jgi:hypothetical protein